MLWPFSTKKMDNSLKTLFSLVFWWWFAVVCGGLPASYQILVPCDLWWFAVMCGGFGFSPVVCGGLR